MNIFLQFKNPVARAEYKVYTLETIKKSFKFKFMIIGILQLVIGVMLYFRYYN